MGLQQLNLLIFCMVSKFNQNKKVLLIGEYSGLHNALKDGLREIGIFAEIASDGDGWKKFPTDIDFSSRFKSSSIIGKILKNITPFFFLRKILKYDVIQLINPLIITPKFNINYIFIRILLKYHSEIYLLCAGDDSYYYKGIKKLRYNPVDDYKKIDMKGAILPFERQNLIKLNQLIVNKCIKIIPVAYDYWIGYENNNKLHPVIPMPVNINKYEYRDNLILEGKIIFFHGINRPGMKGSKYIKEAFEIMKKKYPNDAEFIILDGVPIAEYLKIIDKVNVVVDQALSYSYGMNALISMAKGKVVMSGAEEEILEIYNYLNHPIINIIPDTQQICEKIEFIMKNKDNIKFMGQESRKFVEQIHCHKIVAKLFTEAWTHIE
jgi:hypothetical protein